MKRPYIILNMFTSIDGRITTGPERNVNEWTQLNIDGDANQITHQLFDELDCDGMISGSDSLLVYGRHEVRLAQDIYWPQKSKAYIVFDGRGRIEWAQSQGLLVVTKENAPDSYIEQLESKEIPYIRAGNGEHIDMMKALNILYQKGFKRIGLTGGGKLNGVFLRQQLIDEVSIVYAPVIVGGSRTPALFDCDDLNDPKDLTRLELLESKPLEKGSVWVRYKVKQ